MTIDFLQSKMLLDELPRLPRMEELEISSIQH